MTIKTNYLDGKFLANFWDQRERELEKELKLARAKKRIVTRVVEKNDEGPNEWVIHIPVEALMERRERKDSVINWKKLVWQMFETYKIPMSTDLLCNKLWLHYEEVPFDRRLVIRNVSAALHYLEAKDQKLFRAKSEGRKGFIYGLKHHFNFNLKLKPYYLAQCLREEGEVVQDDNLISQEARREALTEVDIN